MVRKCVIQGCESKTSIAEHRGVTYHSIPFDAKARETWKINCKLDSDKVITKNVLVCSRHFRRADFQQIKGNKFILIQGAVPTIFPWGKVPHSDDLGTAKADTSASVEETIAQIMADTAELNALAGIKSKFQLKRASSEVFDDKPSKVLKSVKDATLESHSESPTSCGEILKSDGSSIFTPGSWLEALEFDGNWHTVKVIEVDNDEGEVLISFEKSKGKSGGKSAHEWIPMNSSRLRQKQAPLTKPCLTFTMGEKCFAKWTGSRKFPATIQQVLGNDEYEVLFDDGFVKLVKGKDISKIKIPNDGKSISKFTSTRSPASSKITKLGKASKQSATSTQTTIKTKIPSTDDWPLISISSLNLEELNLPVIPNDGEWCCHWVNDQPIGREGFLQVGDHKKPTVIVDDWRLPPNWVKHMYQRSNVLGKWDVILVNPDIKRFRSKADLKTFIEEQGGVYNPDIYDFSIHRRRAKDIGAYVFTKDYVPPPPRPKPIVPELPSVVDASIIASVLESTPLNETPVVDDLPPADLMTTTTEPENIEKQSKIEPQPLSPLQQGYVYVGSLKVQLVDNLFRCPEQNCNKNFRKENHLQIHVKHYHDDLAKSLGVCPNMQDLASKRTLGTPTMESHPKNQISNQLFFTKLHQQDLNSIKHRKSSTPKASAPTTPITSPVHIMTDSIVTSEELSKILGSPAATPSPTIEETVTTPTFIQHPTGDSLLSPILSPNNTPKPSIKKRRIDNSGRKKNQHRLTKKVTKRIKNTDQDTVLNDSQDVQNPISKTPEQKSPKVTQKDTKEPELSTVSECHPISISESPIDVTHTNEENTVAMDDSPKYTNENGETIKIVRMRQEEIINCLCSYSEEDGLMIQCELCLCWQHGVCNGIEKESQVPEKYVCYICRNPERGRSSLRYVHDQDWLFEGKLPTGSYHQENPNLEERTNLLKKCHTLTANLLEIQQFMHSLRMKIKIAQNKDHPKLYLWAKKWEESTSSADNIKKEEESLQNEGQEESDVKETSAEQTKTENDDIKAAAKILDEESANQPNIPQPEAPIDPVECQGRLWEHIRTQQSYVMDRLVNIESQVLEIESMDNVQDLKSADFMKISETISEVLKDLEAITKIAKINAAANEISKFVSPVKVEKSTKLISS